MPPAWPVDDTDLDDDPVTALSPLAARDAVIAFATRRGEPALRLALHASLPQVLDATLVHLLRLNFEPMSGPAAEADVLVAPFCRALGNGWYRFADHARSYLSQQLDASYPDERVERTHQVAVFLLDHLERERHGERASADAAYRGWIEAERWNALAWADPAAAAEQLAAALAHTLEPGAERARLRVGALASSLQSPLAAHARLVAYAAGVQGLQANDAQAAELLQVLGDEPLEVGAVRLPAPAGVARAALRRASSRSKAPRSEAGQAAPPREDAPQASQASQSSQSPPASGVSPPPTIAPELETLHEEETRHAATMRELAEPAEPITVRPEAAEPITARPARGPERSRTGEVEYSAYISYAHADDAASNGWISLFARELERGLVATLRGMRVPPVHLSGDNGPVAGDLGEALHRRIESSFALVAVVGDQYVHSTWALQEMDHFLACFGPEARSRIYVLAMSEQAIHRLTASMDWKRLFGEQPPLWMPFYDREHPWQPLPIYQRAEVQAPDFRAPFLRLRDDLARRMRLAVADSARRDRPAGTSPASAQVRVYIESNRNDPSLWQDLGERLQHHWKSIMALASPKTNEADLVRLTVRGLPIDRLEQFSLDDADGVVMLWGQKSEESLVAQITRVERRLPGRQPAAAALVLRLVPPHDREAPDSPPVMGWPVGRVRRESLEFIDPDPVVEDFLQNAFMCLLRRTDNEAGPA